MEGSTTEEEDRKHESKTISKIYTRTTTTTSGGKTSTMEEETRNVEKVDEEATYQAQQVEMRQLHTAALEEVVSVNSFFTAAVFIGLSFNALTTSLVNTCQAGQDVAKHLVVSEVTSFSCFLFSSLVAQGLKLQMTLSSLKYLPRSRFHQHGSSQVKHTHISPTILRIGMIFCALGSIFGTIFLMISMISVIEIRLGLIDCETSSWSRSAIYPLITLVSAGVCTFICPVLYSVITYK